MFSNLFRITFTPATSSIWTYSFSTEAFEIGLPSHPQPYPNPQSTPPAHRKEHFTKFRRYHTRKDTKHKIFIIKPYKLDNQVQYTCLGGRGSCTTGSRVMNFLSLTMLRTSYNTHISVKALLKLFLTESQGQRDGWNFTNPKKEKSDHKELKKKIQYKAHS